MTCSAWAVVLAGGSGERVSAMTRGADGRAVPKQFWAFDSRTPMVRWALARARRVAPSPRVLVVVNDAHREFWGPVLADVPRRNILAQPCNRGTAAAVLLALVEIQARGSAASPVVFLPSDHFVGDEGVLHQALAAAVQASRRDGHSVVLLGISPADVEAGYGWIVPDAAGAVARVRRFVEKPPAEDVGELLQRGALINSFILAARAHALLAVVGQMLPDVLRAFRRGLAAAPPSVPLRRLYDDLPSLDLSRDVLESAARHLSVLRVPPCGWSDLGTPDRLREFLSRPPALSPTPQSGIRPATAA